MANFVKFWDSVSLQPIEISQDVKDLYINSPQQNTSLHVRIAATHSGKVTRNNGFYLPHKMKNGATTWTAQYNKPVQVHHEDQQDPIGRVIRAEYVDTSRGIRDSWDGKNLKDEARPLSDTLMEAFCEGKLSFKECVDVVDKYFIRDFNIVDDPDYEGLGYIELIANVTDLEAIQKIVDGRYLTGSVGASTNQAVCSVCKQDWAGEDGRCDHSPGKVYDGAKAVLIAGDLTYDEYSFVNKPADRHSRVIEVNIGGIQDFVTIDSGADDRIPEVMFKMVDTATDNNKSEEDNNMTVKDEKVAEENKEEVKEEEEVKDQAIEDEEAKAIEEDPVKLFWGDEYEEIVGDDVEEGKHYAEMLMALLDDVKDEDREEIEKQIKDARLTAKQRKGLAGSTFCGPDRSFPVNDCAHYTAALRLIGRYKGPGDKDRIRACIERKGKRMGCSGASEKKDSVDFGRFVLDYFDQFSDEELTQMFDGLQATFKERKMESGCGEAENNTFQDKVAELEEQLEASRKENKSLNQDLENLQDALTGSQAVLRQTKQSQIVDLKHLSGEEFDVTKLQDELKEKSTEEVEQILKDLNGQVDIGEIAGRLNSGLSNNPKGTVEDPTQKIDNMSKKETIELTKEKLEWVRDTYLTLRLESQEKANVFLNNCKKQGIIPAEFPVQDKS